MYSYEELATIDESRIYHHKFYDVYEEMTTGDMEKYKEKAGILNLNISEDEVENCISQLNTLQPAKVKVYTNTQRR